MTADGKGRVPGRRRARFGELAGRRWCALIGRRRLARARARDEIQRKTVRSGPRAKILFFAGGREKGREKDTEMRRETKEGTERTNERGREEAPCRSDR